MTINIAFLIPFLLFSILNIYYEKNSNRFGILLTKPFLIPFLMLFYLLNESSVNYLILLALFFGFLGDVFLLWSNKQNYILAGIVSFLAGHIFYICVFVENSYMVKEIPLWFLLFFIPYIGGALLLFKKLFSSMQSMKLPAIVYMSVIFVMSFTSFSRIWTAPFLSVLLTFSGSLAFIISDSLLAFNMFKIKKQRNDVIIMITYILAQLLIILGLLI
jgi:uncharacterized membrane protein YhhN